MLFSPVNSELSLLSLPDISHVGILDSSCAINTPRASSRQLALKASTAPGAAQQRRKWKLHPEEQPAAATGHEPGRGFLQETNWGKVACPEVRPLWALFCPLPAYPRLDPSPQPLCEAAGRKAALRKQR